VSGHVFGADGVESQSSPFFRGIVAIGAMLRDKLLYSGQSSFATGGSGDWDDCCDNWTPANPPARSNTGINNGKESPNHHGKRLLGEMRMRNFGENRVQRKLKGPCANGHLYGFQSTSCQSRRQRFSDFPSVSSCFGG